MQKATFVKDVSEHFQGEARLYKIEDGSHVVASSISHSYANEVMVFPADESGEVTSFLEEGVAKPAGRFEEALADAGYEL